MMKRSISLLTLIAICIMCISGCGEKYVSPDDKYDQYVRLNNTYLQVVEHSASRYFKTFGSEATLSIPNDLTAIPTFMLIAGIPANSKRSMEYANKKPASVADAAVLLLCEKSMSYVNVFEEITTYYNDKKYESDDFAKGQELHTRYLTVLEECEAAFDDFVVQIAAMEIESLEKSLKELKKEGNDYEYYLLKCIIDGQKMVDYFNQNDIGDTNFLSIDKGEFEPLYQAYTEDCESLTKAISEKDDWDFKNTTIQNYVKLIFGDAQSLHAALGGQEPDTDETPIENIMTTQNRLIVSYNART